MRNEESPRSPIGESSPFDKGVSIPRHRLEGWEARLDAAVAQAAAADYALGQFDCFRFACLVVEALTGVDRWPEFAGRYSTRRESMAALARYGSSFTEAGTAFFGVPPVSWRLARRGDVLEFEQQGEKHLGVCIGSKVALMSDKGLLRIPVRDCNHAWRVG